MIKVASPSMVINAADAPFPHYEMDRSMTFDDTASVPYIMAVAAFHAEALKQQFGKQKLTLIINCHGIASYRTGAHLGAYGLKLGAFPHVMNDTHIEAFSKIQPWVDEIWIVSCNAAANLPGDPGEDGNGYQRCKKIANKVRATVLAPTSTQSTLCGGSCARTFPLGEVDDWEPPVITFYPDGGASAQPGQLDPWYWDQNRPNPIIEYQTS